VPQSVTDAYMWFTLAAQGGFPDAAEKLDPLAKQMAPEQIDEARRRAAEWAAGHSARR